MKTTARPAAHRFEAIDLTSYDVIVVNSSAGKDSQAMLDHVHGLAVAQGVEDRLVVVHADLGRVEWQGTKELAAEQAAHYGVRFEVVRRERGDLLQQIDERGMFPSNTARFCTSDQKRDQVKKLLTKLANEWHGNTRGKNRDGRQVRILNCLGFRAEESGPRSKKCETPHKCDKRNTNGRRHVDEWYPIARLTESEVWAVIADSGVRHHRAYELGMPRLSCVFCIFAPKNALLIAGEHNPELLDQYCDVEERIGHTFRQDLPIVEIRNSLAAGERGDVNANTCGGCWGDM